MKGIIKALIIIPCAGIITLAILLAYLTITEYRPADTEDVNITGQASGGVKSGITIKLLTWNIGYGALGKDADFFMDGGKSVRSSDYNEISDNLSNISRILASNDAGVIFLQETDIESTRSYYINEWEALSLPMENRECMFAYNFSSNFIPYPLPPIGMVHGGIGTLSYYHIDESQRISLPSSFSYPVSLCNLKRCLLVSRIAVTGTDKELVLINLHLEAYDDGEGKIAQTNALKEFIEAEYAKGNYVIAGGDFNQTFSNIDTSMYPSHSATGWSPGLIDTDEFEDHWSFWMDTDTPTCRSLSEPYDEEDEDFRYYMLDGFIV